MSSSRLWDPLKRPAFRRLAASYAINEMGDWLGLVALSVLVFELTGSALATTAALPRHRLPAGAARRPSSSPGSSGRPPRFVLPSIYAAEAATFLGLALLADHFSLAAVVALAAVDGALALTAKTLTRAVDRGDARARGRAAGGKRDPQRRLHRRRRGRPGRGRRRRRRPRGPVGAAPRRRLLLRDRLDRASPPSPCRRRSPSRASCASSSAPGSGYIREHIAPCKRLIGAQAVVLVFFTVVVPVEVVYAKETLACERHRLRHPARQLGSRDGGRQRRLRHRCDGLPLPLLLFFSTLGVGAGYLGMAAAPTLPSPAPPRASAASATASSGWRWSAPSRS